VLILTDPNAVVNVTCLLDAGIVSRDGWLHEGNLQSHLSERGAGLPDEYCNTRG